MSVEIIEKYLDLILEANEVTNLTRITDRDKARILHIEDSLAGLPEINSAPSGPYADLGTGGGFPGVPVAISTLRETLLVDSVKKKVKILDDLIEKIGYENTISTYAGRIEDLAKEKPEYFSVVSARALTQLVSLLELACPLLSKGGRLVCYKANVSQEELHTALSVCELLGMEYVSRREFCLSDNETHREILVFEKKKKPKVKLPRRVGLAQHDPLRVKQAQRR